LKNWGALWLAKEIVAARDDRLLAAIPLSDAPAYHVSVPWSGTELRPCRPPSA
jgi:hypothetical protein